MNRQIIGPDPGLNYNVAISTGDPGVRIVCWMLQFFHLKI